MNIKCSYPTFKCTWPLSLASLLSQISSWESHKQVSKVGLRLNSGIVIHVTMSWECLWSLWPTILSYPPLILLKAPQLPPSVLIPEKKNTAPWKSFSQCDFPDVGMTGMRNSVEKAMPKSCVEPLFLEHPLPCLSVSVCVSLCLSASFSVSFYLHVHLIHCRIILFCLALVLVAYICACALHPQTHPEI